MAPVSHRTSNEILAPERVEIPIIRFINHHRAMYISSPPQQISPTISGLRTVTDACFLAHRIERLFGEVARMYILSPYSIRYLGWLVPFTFSASSFHVRPFPTMASHFISSHIIRVGLDSGAETESVLILYCHDLARYLGRMQSMSKQKRNPVTCDMFSVSIPIGRGLNRCKSRPIPSLLFQPIVSTRQMFLLANQVLLLADRALKLASHTRSIRANGVYLCR